MDTPLRPVILSESREAHRALLASGAVIRTPLVRLNWSPAGAAADDAPEIWLKLECLQPTIGSFKVRGAGNAMASADPAALARHGVATASAGNMGQGVAANARLAGVRCTVVVPSGAPRTKVEAIERLGATVVAVPFDEWWQIIQTGACPQAPPGAVFVHPVLDQAVLAGNSTVALEILEQLPDADVVLVPYGGGALACGIGSVVRALRPDGRCRVLACEPATAAPCAQSFAQGECCAFERHAPSFVDGCGGKALLPPMWPIARAVLDGGLAVELEHIAAAIKVLVERNGIVAEGAGACPVAAAMVGQAAGCCPKRGKIVCVVSGRGLDTHKLIQILAGCPRAPFEKPTSAGCPATARSMLGVGAVLALSAVASLAALAFSLRRKQQR